MSAPGPLLGLFTADEEIGSPEGGPMIEALREQRRKLRDATLSPQAYADQQKALRTLGPVLVQTHLRQ